MKLRRSLFVSAGLTCMCAGPLLAQITNLPSFEISVQPTNYSLMVTQTINPVFVTISNAALFTNITVEGMFAGSNYTFLDQGTPPDVAANDGTFSTNLTAPSVFVVTQTLALVITGDVLDTNDPPTVITNIIENHEVEYIIVPRPDNDDFVDAIKITSTNTVVQGNNEWGTLEVGEPQHASVPSVDASVWWYWPSPVATNVLVDLGGTEFNAVLAVYRGPNVSNLTAVAAATGSPATGRRAYAAFNSQIGATYRIAVSGFASNEVGEVRLRLVAGAVPDLSGPVVSIISPPSLSLVTESPVTFSGTVKERNVNESGVKRVFLRVNTLTNEYDALIFPEINEWSVSVPLPPGTNVVRANGVDINGNVGPDAAVVVRYLDPVNDLFANAVELLDVGGVLTATNLFATKEPGEPFHAGNEGGRSIWYRWQAPSSGDLTLNTQGSDFDTLLALYTGTALTNLLELASNDDAYAGSGYSLLTHRVVAGQVYYIAVDGLGAAGGLAVLQYAFTSTEVLFSVSVATPLGGAVLPGSALYPSGTAVTLRAVPEKNFSFVRWEDQDGTVLSTEPLLPLVVTRNRSLRAVFRLARPSDTFSSGDLRKLSWSTTGYSPWFVEMVDGQYAARSGPIADLQSSSLVLTTNLYAGTGVFDVKVSSEEGWDWIEFYLNGVRLDRWSGEKPWTNFLFRVNEGPNTLEWRYVKDGSHTEGRDVAYVDNVYVPLEKPDPPPPPMLSILARPNQSYQLTVVGQPGARHVIQVSPDLAQWTGVATNQLVGATWLWVDATTPAPSRRYYRVVAP